MQIKASAGRTRQYSQERGWLMPDVRDYCAKLELRAGPVGDGEHLSRLYQFLIEAPGAHAKLDKWLRTQLKAARAEGSEKT